MVIKPAQLTLRNRKRTVQRKPTFWKTRDVVLFACAKNTTNAPFNLEEYKTEFRFLKNYVHLSSETLNIFGVEAMCIFLKRSTYPGRYSDRMHRFFFFCPVPRLSMISNMVK